MRTLPSALALACLTCGCSSFGVKGQLGYTAMSLGGDVALSPSGSGTIRQDIESGLGLGDPQGSVYGRLELDCGVPVLTVSGFTFQEEGQGQLGPQFGQIPAGTTVQSEVDFTNFKAALAFDIDLGVVKVAPGVAVDVFDMDIQVRDSLGLSNEDIDVLAPVPMAFLRATVDLGAVALVGEGGYMSLDVDDVDGTFWDAEGWIEVRPTGGLFLFGGYRHISIAGTGIVDNQDFDADLTIAGWQVGGGFRF